MLEKERVREAEKNVKRYMAEGFLKKHPFKKEIFQILKKNSHESLEIAGALFTNNKSDLWLIVTSYYSMYYISNAVLLKLGYKVGEKISHKVTADSLIVFVRDRLKKHLIEEYEQAKNEALAGIKADSLLEDFDYERKKRSTVQYETQESERHSKAKTSFNRAKNFLFEMEKLLA